MTPELRLVKGDAPTGALATFTHDARLPFLLAKVLAGVWLVAGLTALLGTALDPKLRFGIASLAIGSALYGLVQLFAGLSRRASRYTLTDQRLDVVRGLLGKRHESVELWRVRDVVLDQSVLDRMRGAGSISVFSTDQVAPVLLIGPVADAQKNYEAIRDAALAARRSGQVVTLQQ